MEIDLTNAHPCPDCRQCLTILPKCRWCAERDQLRAELENAKLNWKLTQERATKWAQEISTAAARAEAAERERDEAQAHAADLRGALEEIRGLNGSAGYLPPHQPTAAKAIEIARAALARTPAQSLARVKAGALREAVEEVRNDEAAQESAATTRGAILCIADRLEVKDGR